MQPWFHHTYNIPALQAISAIAHARHTDPTITWTLGWKLWQEARHQPAWCRLLQENLTVAERFYTLKAERQMDLADLYECVHGTCTVQWYNGRNIGGYGIAGCPCDNMKDPRGQLIQEAQQ